MKGCVENLCLMTDFCAGVAYQPVAGIQQKKDVPTSKVWTPSAVEYWKRLIAMCEDGLLEGAAWQREGSSLVGKRARSKMKTKGKRDGFVVAWCSRVVAQEPLPCNGAGRETRVEVTVMQEPVQAPDKQEVVPAPELLDLKPGVGARELADQSSGAVAACELPIAPAATSSPSSAQTQGEGGSSDEAEPGAKSERKSCPWPMVPVVKRRRKNEDAVQVAVCDHITADWASLAQLPCSSKQDKEQEQRQKQVSSPTVVGAKARLPSLLPSLLPFAQPPVLPSALSTLLPSLLPSLTLLLAGRPLGLQQAPPILQLQKHLMKAKMCNEPRAPTDLSQRILFTGYARPKSSSIG